MILTNPLVLFLQPNNYSSYVVLYLAFSLPPIQIIDVSFVSQTFIYSANLTHHQSAAGNHEFLQIIFDRVVQYFARMTDL